MAGLGTRLRPFTDFYPKPCLPFLNLPLAYYGFHLLKTQGVTDLVYNVHHLPNAVHKTLKPLAHQVRKLFVSDESAQILGSGGALWNAQEYLKSQDYFWVANGDEILVPLEHNPLQSLVDLAIKKEPLAVLLTCDHPELLKKFKAVWINSQNQVIGFGKEPPEPHSRPVHYTGYKLFSRKIFDYLPSGESNIFYDVLVKAMSMGEKVLVAHHPHLPWYETGDFSSWLYASRTLALQHWDYVKQVHQSFGQNFERHILSPQDSLVTPTGWRSPQHWTCRGHNVIGPQSVIPENTDLENCIVLEQARLEANKKYCNQFVF